MIADTLLIALLVTCSLSVAMALALFAIKVLHRRRLVAQEERRTAYVAALGDLMARSEVPTSLPDEWSEDPVFSDVLFEYVSIVTGGSRRTLDAVVDVLDIRDRLVGEVRGARRQRRRLRGLIYLVEIADPGQRDLFRECLADPVAEVRLHAARGLAVIGDDTSVPLLLDLLDSETPWNTGRLADILVSFGSDAVPQLTGYLVRRIDSPSRNPDAMREVIRAVGLIGDLEAEPTLLELLVGGDSVVRVGAASALAHCGTPASVPGLIAALDDVDWRVRARAADALATFSDGSAVEPLARRLRDPAWWVRQNAAKALAEVPGGIERLAKALNDEDAFCRDAARHQLGTKKVIRAARHRLETGIGTGLDRRIVAASLSTIEDLLEAPDDGTAPTSRRVLVGDGVVDRFRVYAGESTLQLVERLRLIRRAMRGGGGRFPSFKDVGGSGPFHPGGSGGGGFRPVGGRFTTAARLAREEARIRAALHDELESIEEESGN